MYAYMYCDLGLPLLYAVTALPVRTCTALLSRFAKLIINLLQLLPLAQLEACILPQSLPAHTCSTMQHSGTGGRGALSLDCLKRFVRASARLRQQGML
jgi:hypothetical protein